MASGVPPILGPPISWMIESAAALSAIVQKWDDFAIILIMLLVNTLLDFNLQEHRALNALKSQMTMATTMCRNGQFSRVTVRELAPGDVFKLTWLLFNTSSRWPTTGSLPSHPPRSSSRKSSSKVCALASDMAPSNQVTSK